MAIAAIRAESEVRSGPVDVRTDVSADPAPQR
jgi:hypothetical protein